MSTFRLLRSEGTDVCQATRLHICQDETEVLTHNMATRLGEGESDGSITTIVMLLYFVVLPGPSSDILVWFEEACFLHSWQQYLVCLQSPLEVTMEQIRYENSWLMY